MFVKEVRNKLIHILNKFPSRSKTFQFSHGKSLYTKWNEKFVPSEEEMFLLKYFLKPDDIVFDIGAYIGQFSYFLSTIIKKGEIYSFEPQKKVFTVLRGSLKKIRNAHLYNLALSDHIGGSTIYIPIVKGHLSSSEASLDPHFNDFSGYKRVKKSNKYVKKKIRLITLDCFCDKNKVSRVDFIKCDVEGHELEVLRGARKCISKFRPILLIEIFPYVYEDHFGNVCDYLKKLNYVGYVSSENKDKVCDLNGETLKNSKGFNYFFVPKDKEVDFLNCFQNKLSSETKTEGI